MCRNKKGSRLAPIGTPRLAFATSPQRHEFTVLIALVASALLVAALAHAPFAPAAPTFSVVVHERIPSTDLAEDLVQAVGGHVTRPLPLIGGFAADVPQNRLPMLARDASISGVYVDGRIQMAAVGTEAWDDIEPNLAWRKIDPPVATPRRRRRDRRHGRADRHRGRAGRGPR